MPGFNFPELLMVASLQYNNNKHIKKKKNLRKKLLDLQAGGLKAAWILSLTTQNVLQHLRNTDDNHGFDHFILLFKSITLYVYFCNKIQPLIENGFTFN